MSRPFQDSNMPSKHNLLTGLGIDDQRARRVWESTQLKLAEQGYELGHEQLGSGASAVVYPAQHQASGKKVAVKIILDPSNERAVQQFHREQRVLASEYIPSEIVPKFVHSIDSNASQPCLIMERIDGVGILEYAKNHELSIPQKIILIERVFQAYRSLHDCNLVHGDPSHKNIFIEPGNRVRLLDFGTSRRASAGYESVNSVVGPAGTPTFAPDSQLLGQESASIQTDIQAVSAVAYTLLTDDSKQDGPSSKTEALHRQTLLDKNVPTSIADIIVQGMRSTINADSSRTTKHFQSCKEVLEAFEQVRMVQARSNLRRRQAILAMAMLVSLVLASWWGYSQYLEAQRTQQQQAISMLQQEISQISRRSHPAVASGIQTVQQNLDAFHQAELSRDSTKVQTARKELEQSMRSVLNLSREIDRFIPIREALGITLERMPWIDSSAAIQKSKDELANLYLNIGKQIDDGDVDNVDQRLGNLQSRLAELANSNSQAQSADRSRTEFFSQRNEVPPRIVQQSAFNAVVVLADSAEGAWQSGDFKHSIALFEQAKQKLENVLPTLETKEESNERMERRTSRLGEEVLALRQQIERTKSERDESDRKTRELESKIATISSQASEDRETAVKAQKDLENNRAELSRLTSELATTKLTLESKQPDADAYVKLKPLYDQIDASLKDANAKITALERERTLMKATVGIPANAAKVASDIQQLNDIQKQIDSLDQTDRKAALEALRNAYTAYRKIKQERINASREYRDSSPTIKAIDLRLAESAGILKNALQSYDHAQNTIFLKIESQIEALRAERIKRLTEDGLLATSTAIQTMDRQGQELVKEKAKYGASHQRVSSEESIPDVAETVKQVFGRSFQDAEQTGALLVAKIANIDVNFRYCPPCEQGTFFMGSPESEKDRSSDEKQVSVWFDNGFYMMETECWNELWNGVMNDKKGDGASIKLPVVGVSHNDCQDFLKNANAKLLVEGSLKATVRLPTEAEWEYACRAGAKTRFSFGDSDSMLGDYGWFESNSGSNLHPVGTKEPNLWGLKDMHGSVWEWTSNWYTPDHPEGKNPTGPSSGMRRAKRGGSYWNVSEYCRSAFRSSDSPDTRNIMLGFRLVLEFNQDE